MFTDDVKDTASDVGVDLESMENLLFWIADGGCDRTSTVVSFMVSARPLLTDVRADPEMIRLVYPIVCITGWVALLEWAFLMAQC